MFLESIIFYAVFYSLPATSEAEYYHNKLIIKGVEAKIDGDITYLDSLGLT